MKRESASWRGRLAGRGSRFADICGRVKVQRPAGPRPRESAPKRPAKLDPFKPCIAGRLAAAAPDRIPAAVLFREVRDRGYVGGETQLRYFERGLLPNAASAPAVASTSCRSGQVRKCTICDNLPLGPKPIVQASATARILIVGQAPGRITHAKGRPFDDASGTS